ncbi:hypothetical protein DAI22_06g107450 [Oryza sativa Japonica Group]|nr:hypothetical protein DAI22_06g107450 [Oryza sativa Japonica Group]
MYRKNNRRRHVRPRESWIVQMIDRDRAGRHEKSRIDHVRSADFIGMKGQRQCVIGAVARRVDAYNTIHVHTHAT